MERVDRFNSIRFVSARLHTRMSSQTE